MRMFCFLLLWLPISVQADPVQQILNDYYRQGLIPGASVAWMTSDGQLHTRVVGMADSEQQIAMTSSSRMLSASIGKSFVAAAFLQAVQSQRISLDTPISRWLTRYTWFDRLPNGDQITVRQLLNHTSGLPDHVYQPEFVLYFAASSETGSALSPQESIALILDQTPLFRPGQGWHYSDTGYLLAGLILEAEYGESWTKRIQAQFIGPLKLQDTEPSDHRQLPRLAVGYTGPDNRLGLPERTLNAKGQLVWHPGTEGAGGGWVTTPSDLVRWGAELWSGRLFSPAVMEELLAGVQISPDSRSRYGLAVVIEPTPLHGEVRRHFGWIPGYVASLRYYPDSGVTFAVQINTDAGASGPDGFFRPLEQQLADAVLSSASDAVNPLLSR